MFLDIFVKKKSFRFFLCICVFSFFSINRIFSQTELPKTWQIGATEFDVSELPLYRRSVGSIFPKLMLEKLQGLSSHGYSEEEKSYLSSISYKKKEIEAINKLQTLLVGRDELAFGNYSENERKQKKKDFDTNIENAKKELDTLREEFLKTSENVLIPDSVSLEFWEKNKIAGTEFALFTPPAGLGTVAAMKSGNLSGMITGKITEVAGYVFISVALYVYPIEKPAIEAFEAGSWEQLPSLAESLSRKILPGVVGQPPAVLTLDTTPKDAFCYIDGNLLDRTRPSIPVDAGKHTVLVEADGFYPSTLEADFTSGKTFVLHCELAPVITADVTLQAIYPDDLPSTEISSSEVFEKPSFFIDGIKLSDNPVVFPMPKNSVIGFVRVPSKQFKKGLFSWFVIEPSKKLEYNIPLEVDDVSELIEHRRNVLYWSLGAFYLYLPVPMLILGQHSDLYNSYQAGNLPKTVEQVNTINNWKLASDIATGVGIGLGINLGVQIVRYIIAADRVKPKILE